MVVTNMRIGIDISQIVYEGTGVSRYVRNIVAELIAGDRNNSYVLFGSSLRRREVFRSFFRSVCSDHPNVTLKVFPFPPTFLTFLWNDLHIIPIEWLIGKVDVFWSSDWVQPPLARAKGVTTIHDVSFLRFPESFADIIVRVQKKRLARAVSECSRFFCDSDATKKDVMAEYHIPEGKLRTVYPGITL